MTRAEREQKVLETVREWLPELVTPGSVIQITACNPAEADGSMFSVTKTRAFICRRGN